MTPPSGVRFGIDAGRAGCEAFDEKTFLRFLGRRLRNLVDDLQVGRHEVRFEPLAAGGEYRGGREVPAGYGYNRGDDVFFARGTGSGWHAVHEHVAHPGLFGDHLLDVARIDEVAVVADAAGLAVIKEQPALGIAVTHVAAAQPAAGGLLGGGALVLEIFDTGGFAGGRARDDFTDDTRWAFVPVVVDNFHVQARNRLTETADRTGADGFEGEAAFDGTVPFENAHVIPAFERFP